MYDFYFGSREEIALDEKKFLLSVKRMLPRWVNSIPDSEYLAIYDDLMRLNTDSETKVLVETGIGASTIVLLYYAMKNNSKLYSWDFHAEKGSYIRSICVETLSAVLGKHILDHWTFIAYNSTSPFVGIPILKDLEPRIDFCFLDSEHTLQNLMAEVKAVNSMLCENAIIAIDDANYDYVHTNESYVNIQRKKLGLCPIPQLENNKCRSFCEEVEDYLKKQWKNVEHIDDSYKKTYASDIFWSYFQADRDLMAGENMEKTQALEHRYDSFRVRGHI